MYEKEKIAALVASVAGTGYVLNKKFAIGHDALVYGRLVPTLIKHKLRMKHNKTITDIFEEMVDKMPNQIAIMHLEQTITFKEMDEKANQIANWALDTMKLKRGDKVALLMENRLEYIWIWMGLLKIGVNVALLNTHITKKSLVHCIAIAGTNILIFGDECSKQVDEIKCELINYRYFIHSATGNDKSTIPSLAENLNIALESAPSIRPNKSIRDGIK